MYDFPDELDCVLSVDCGHRFGLNPFGKLVDCHEQMIEVPIWQKAM